eukprot:TRINITY_DN2818_c0_g1_i3.p1 TRINITY_DN2818_c0_g1~~TRINITY_DN2818_c0_g1_i3.p1  ORF type:complete len:334 (-),score=64.65 TRINITY_DN2818_c0_g1_i3:590-1591(-)
MALEGYYTDGWDASRIYQALLLVGSFLAGAVMCGLLVSRNEVHFGKSAYGVALCVNSLLLVFAVLVFNVEVPSDWPAYCQGKWLALYLQSAACGLQNGMCTAHFGAVVRTTHLTGLMTDSGLTIGRLLSILLRTRCNRRNFLPLDSAEIYVDLKKLLLFASLLAGYILGVFAGAHLADVLGINSLFVPASVTGLGGLTYTVAKARCWEVFERAEADKLAHDLQEAEEIFFRAKSQIVEWQSVSPRATDELQELDVGVGKALDLLHDMEARLQRKMTKSLSRCGDDAAETAAKLRRTRSHETADKRNDSARRIHSAPSLLKSLSLDPAALGQGS